MLGSGEMVGKYRLEQELGAGGMGAVWLAVDPEIGRKVAIKVLAVSGQSPEMLERFLREARTVAQLRSEHTVRIFDVGRTADGTPYIVMEFLDGHDLRHIVQADGPRPPEIAVDYVLQACEALAEAHGVGIVHRDIKTANLVLIRAADDTDQIKLLDFGIAKADSADGKHLTRSLALMGTPAYMSPEQVRSSGEVDARTDIWALGVVLYELLTGKLPFVGDGAFDVIAAVQRDAATPLPPAIPERLRHAVERALAKDREARYQNVAAFASAIHAFARDPHRATYLVDRAYRYLKLGVAGADTMMADRREHRDRRAADDERPTIEPPAEAPPFVALEAAIPAELQSVRIPVIELFSQMFDCSTPVAPGVVQLHGREFAGKVAHDVFAVFMADDQPGILGAQTFASYVKPLRTYLEKLDTPRVKVVIVVSRSGELGRGVRDEIAVYRRELNALVVPIWTREIEVAYRRGHLWETFEHRLDELFTNPDPFNPDATASDPMQYIGAGNYLADLLATVEQGGRIVSITALPGSGKSTLLRLLQYNLPGRDYVCIPCAEIAPSVRVLGHEILGGLGNAANGAPAAPNPQEFTDQLTSQLASSEPRKPYRPSRELTGTLVGFARNRRPVLVLEDADWLIARICQAEKTPSRDDARALWTALASACRNQQLDVIVTSVRGHELGAAMLGDWQNPARPHDIEVSLLNPRATAHLVHERAAGVAEVDDDALTEIYRLTYGNVGLVLRLCSNAYRDHAARGAVGPLSVVRIRAADIRRAAIRLSSVNRPLGPMFASILSADEQAVLCALARSPSRSMERLRRVLPAPAAVDRAMGTLEAMGIVGHDARRYRVLIPLLGHWARLHLLQTEQAQEDTWRRRTKMVTLGLIATGFLLGIYFVWLKNERREIAGSDGECAYWVDAPRRGQPEQRVSIQINRQCATTAARPFAVQHEGATAAQIDLPEVTPCLDVPACALRAQVTLLPQSGPQYRFRLVTFPLPSALDPRPPPELALEFRIERDALASFKDTLAAVFALMSMIPALLGVGLAFYKDALGAVRGWLRSPAAAKAPAEPPKDARNAS